MRIKNICESLLLEQFVEPEEPLSFGVNAPDYDDMSFAYKGEIKSVYTVVQPVEGIYIPVMIRIDNGLVQFTYSENSNIANMLISKTYFRDIFVIKSLPYMNQIVFVLFGLVKKYNFRLHRLTFRARSERIARRFNFMFKSPYIRSYLKRYRFKTFSRVYNEEDKSVYYQFIKNDD